MMVRVPTHVDTFTDFNTQVGNTILQLYYQQYSKRPELLEKWKAEQREQGDNRFENMRVEDLDPSRTKVTAASSSSFAISLRTVPKLSELVMQMGWTFMVSEGTDYFITSDHPFCMVDPTQKNSVYGVGLAHENIEVSLPLSRNMAFFAGWKSAGRCFQRVPTGFVERINLRTAQYAARELIAPRREFPGALKIMRGFNGTRTK